MSTSSSSSGTGITEENMTIVRVPVPQDETADAAALIRDAIESVSDVVDTPVKILLEAGVYRLFWEVSRGGKLAMMHLWKTNSLTIEGAVDDNGDPATILQMQLQLQNDIHGARHFDIRDSNDFHMKNIIIDHYPRPGTAAQVTQIDRDAGQITINVLPGMPHFDGMKSYSANNWNLDTRQLIRGPSVTRGTSHVFPQWTLLEGTRYTLTNTEIAQLLQVGQGLSFHFNVYAPQGRAIDVYRCTNARFENIFVYSSIGMVMGAGDNKNMIFQRFHIKPQGNSLAVGPRDGIHLARSGGRLLMDDIYIKGVRWDPIVIYTNMAHVLQRVSDKAALFDDSDPKTNRFLKATQEGHTVDFWSGEDPSIRVVSTINGGLVEFTEALDSSVQANVIVTSGAWHWQEAILRNSRIESNDGTALVYENDNLLVENCVFRNNLYSNIGLGPTSTNAGMFARNITIRNNIFEGSTWQAKYSGSYLARQRGTIALLNLNEAFQNDASYHRQILIEGNMFKDLYGTNDPAGIDIKLVKGVIIRNNQYINVGKQIIVDPITTKEITITDGGPPRAPSFPIPIVNLPPSPPTPIIRPSVASLPTFLVTSPSGSIDPDLLEPTLAPVVNAPCNMVQNTMDSCDDNDTCSFYVSIVEGRQTCIWLRARPDWWPILCSEGSDARLICAETCSVCHDDCEDSMDFNFNVNGAIRDCAWLSIRPSFHNEYCIGDTMNQCRETCNMCLTAPAQPSTPPAYLIQLPTDQPVSLIAVPTGLCFSGDCLVEVQGKGRMQMKHVGVGDFVKVNSNNDADLYERIYGFAHRNVNRTAKFLRFFPSNLELSKDHLIFIEGQCSPVPASTVRAGDVLSNGQRVDNIQEITKVGIYAPFTPSGTINVNGIAASNYVTLQDNCHALQLGPIKTPFTFHWLEHTFQFPHRLWCCYLGFDDLGVSENGLGKWVEGPYHICLAALRLHPMIMIIFLLPSLLVLQLFALAEMMITA